VLAATLSASGGPAQPVKFFVEPQAEGVRV